MNFKSIKNILNVNSIITLSIIKWKFSERDNHCLFFMIPFGVPRAFSYSIRACV